MKRNLEPVGGKSAGVGPYGIVTQAEYDKLESYVKDFWVIECAVCGVLFERKRTLTKPKVCSEVCRKVRKRKRG